MDLPTPRPLAASPVRRPEVQVLAFIAGATAVKVALALLQSPDDIEAYHWLYGRHPAAGYYDHPAMIGWFTWISTSLFGDSLLALRLPTILGSGLAVWFTFLAGRRMYDAATGRLAALLVGLTPLTARFATETGPDGPLLLFWAAAAWALAHAVPGDGRKWWLLSGLFIGAAMDSKYTGAMLAIGLVVFLVVSPEHRHWLKRREPYLAGLIAAAAFLPTVLWNASNGWESFEYQGVERVGSATGFTLRNVRTFVFRQMGLVTPFVLAWAVKAGIDTVRRWKLSGWADRLNACLGVPTLAIFLALTVIRSVRAHWPVPAYLGLFLLSSAAVLRGGPWGKRLHAGTIAVLMVAGVALPGIVAGIPFKDRNRWEAAAEEIRRLRPDFVITEDYHHAAQLSWRLRPLTAWDMTPLGQGRKSFPSWWRSAPFAGKDAVVIFEPLHNAEELELVRARFDRVEGPYPLEGPDGESGKTTYRLWIARGYRPPPNGLTLRWREPSK